MRAGLVSVPVNHKFPRDTIDFVLRDSSVKLVFCDGERRALVPSGLPLVDFDSKGEEGFEALLSPGDFTTIHPEPRETAMVLYTSGSTGRPKGVPLSHDGHLWTVRSRVEGRQDMSRECFLVAEPLFHMNGLRRSKMVVVVDVAVVLEPLVCGRRYVGAMWGFL